MTILRLVILYLFCFSLSAKEIVNVYAWSGEVPDFVIRQFEKETGIKVNFSTYENNEILLAKLRANKKAGYDIIMPSSYMVDHMHRLDMLIPLDKTKLTNWHHLNPTFLHPSYDPNTEYSLPYLWGVSGIFVNDQYYQPQQITQWSDLWQSRFNNQLLLLDDAREVFSMALIALGFPPNDHDKNHIHAAFLYLKKLMKNVKVFSTDTVASLIIDEDARIGMAWNGDTFKAMQENTHVKFIFPTDGFLIWVDNFSIPKGAPHLENAYRFLNYLLRPEVAKAIALNTNFPITNLSAQKMLPAYIRNNPIIYPPKKVLARGYFQTDIGIDQAALNLYEQYWEELKMNM